MDKFFLLKKYHDAIAGQSPFSLLKIFFNKASLCSSVKGTAQPTDLHQHPSQHSHTPPSDPRGRWNKESKREYRTEKSHPLGVWASRTPACYESDRAPAPSRPKREVLRQAELTPHLPGASGPPRAISHHRDAQNGHGSILRYFPGDTCSSILPSQRRLRLAAAFAPQTRCPAHTSSLLGTFRGLFTFQMFPLLSLFHGTSNRSCLEDA